MLPQACLMHPLHFVNIRIAWLHECSRLAVAPQVLLSFSSICLSNLAFHLPANLALDEKEEKPSFLLLASAREYHENRASALAARWLAAEPRVAVTHEDKGERALGSGSGK